MADHPTGPSAFRVVPTPLLARIGARRLLVLEFPTAREPRPARVRLEVGSGVIEQDLGIIPPGETMATVLISEVSEPTSGEARLSLGDHLWHAAFSLRPARPWTVFVVPHSHTDIGFTHPASEVVEIHNENTDEAITLCDLTRDWPEGCRFKWTCEVSWQVQNYLRSRPAERVARLQDCLRRGQMEVAAMYAGLHTDICGLEELIRSVYLAARLRREWRIPVDTVMVSDVPGVTWAYAQVLAKAGLRYLVLADNNFVAPFLRFTDVPRPFYWQGPDGSRILAWYTDDPTWAYIEGFRLGFGESYRHVLRALPLRLAELEEKGYPYEAVQFQLASDNVRVTLRPALIAREWQEQWANPRVRIATAREFLAYMESAYGDRFPIRRGDWSNWWSGTVLDFPHETALGRRVKGELAAAEVLNTWAGLVGPSAYPADLLTRGYDNLLAFDEHSGGGGLWRPKSEEEQQRALYEGYAFPHEAACAAAQALEAGLSALAEQASNDGDDHAFFVVNPLSWVRTDLVEITPPAAVEVTAVRDPQTGQVLPVQTLPSGKARFVAPQVSPLGYKTFPLVFAQVTPVGQVEVNGRRLENRHYRLELDERGRIVSILDKESGRELVDAADRLGFGQFVWYQPKPHREFNLGDEFPEQRELYEGVPVPGELLAPLDGAPQIKVGMRGPVSASLVVEREVEGPFHLCQEVALHAETKRVDVSYTLTPQGPVAASKARLAYLYFPFSLSAPRFRVELPGALLTPEEDQLTGACRDFWPLQHWVAVYDREHTVLVSALDTPLVELGHRDPTHQQFLQRWQAQGAALWFRVLALGPARGATESPYTKGQPLTCRFAIAAHAGPLDPVAAMRHGWGTRNPLLSAVLPPRRAGALPAGQGAWCGVRPDHVMLVAAKRAEDGDGLIFRLWEAAGRPCSATLSLPDLVGDFSAWRCNLVEEDLAPLEMRGRQVQVPMAGFGIETVRIRPRKN